MGHIIKEKFSFRKSDYQVINIINNINDLIKKDNSLWKLPTDRICNNPDSNCEVSARRFYCPECKTEYGLNFQYHISFIVAPIIIAFIYCFARLGQ